LGFKFINDLGRKLKKAARRITMDVAMISCKNVRNDNGHQDVTVDGKPIDDRNETEVQKAINESDGDISTNGTEYMEEDVRRTFKVHDDATMREKDRAVAQAQQRGRTPEPSDTNIEAMDESRPEPRILTSQVVDLEKGAVGTPEQMQKAVYPKTVKLHIPTLRQWVEEVKYASFSKDELMEEYLKDREEQTQENIQMSEEMSAYVGRIGKRGRNQDKAINSLYDSATYKVARKIWYVGRKPAHWTDDQWNEHTKTMRPAEGTFDMKREERWRDGLFKYDVNYKYTYGKQ